MNITIVVPLYNEEESLPELHAWIQRVMKANNYSYEIIFVNDGSTDKSWNVIEKLAEKDNNVKGLKLRARATGELSNAQINLEGQLKEASKYSPDNSGAGGSTPGGGNGEEENPLG